MVGCKWIFKKKIDMDEKLHTYKARLMYVKTDFLNEKLTEDVFMAQPEGFENAKYPKRVCKLPKAFLCLKQASRLASISPDFHEIENSKKENLPLHHGIKISKDLCSKTDKELNRMSRVPYASAVGLIMYAMTCTRPDVSFALSMVSRHHQNPEEELKVTSYYDASWKIDKDDSRSQSGWVFLLNGGAVTWKSSKKDIVTGLTPPPHASRVYCKLVRALKEAIWMKNFMIDLGVVSTVLVPLNNFFDK
ncbi:retrotransposon protein, putative, ty1-copia subclass [Tanacetum coccineum]